MLNFKRWGQSKVMGGGEERDPEFLVIVPCSKPVVLVAGGSAFLKCDCQNFGKYGGEKKVFSF